MENKQITLKPSADPFYSVENMARLRKSVAEIESTGGTIHEVSDKNNDYSDGKIDLTNKSKSGRSL